MIEAKHLTKRYGKTVAVDEVSFTVRPGRVTGFLGPNGAGKSTTMRMILGLDAPTSGEVRVDGKPYRQLHDPLRSVGALLDAKSHRRWPQRRQPPQVAGRQQRYCPPTGGPGARSRRTQRRGRETGRDVLTRNEPAVGHRRGPARRPSDGDVRRADQRSRPRGHPVDPQPDEVPGLRRPHGVPIEPSHERDGPDRRSPARDRQRPHHRRRRHRSVHQRAHAPRLSGFGPWSRPTWPTP